MPGPFTSYAPPGVYTITEIESTVATLPSTLRIPVLIGVGREELTVENFELFRGSSPSGDLYVPNEDVSSQFITGEEKTFRVMHYPITNGDGTNTATTSASDVKVFINDEETFVSLVDGENGYITLLLAPGSGADVKVSYYFHRSDTLVEAEDVSAQATGETNVFKVANLPITDGSDSGLPTTSTSAVSAKINDVAVAVEEVDGQNGLVYLQIPVVETVFDVTTLDGTERTFTVSDTPIVDAEGNVTDDESEVSVSITIGAETQVNAAEAVDGSTGEVTIPYFVVEQAAENVSAQFTGLVADLTFTTAETPIVGDDGLVSTSPADVAVSVTVGSGTAVLPSASVTTVAGATGDVTIAPFIISDSDSSASGDLATYTDGTFSTFDTSPYVVDFFPIVNSSGAVTTTVSDVVVAVTAGSGTAPADPVVGVLAGSTGSVTFDTESLLISDIEDLTSLSDGSPATFGAAFSLTNPEAVKADGSAVANLPADMSGALVPGSGTVISVSGNILTGSTVTSTSVAFDVTEVLIQETDYVLAAVAGDTYDVGTAILDATGVALVDGDLPSADLVFEVDGSPVSVLHVNSSDGILNEPGIIVLNSATIGTEAVTVTFKRLPNTTFGDTLEVEYSRLPNTAASDVLTVSYNRLPATGAGDVVYVSYNSGAVPGASDTVEITYNHRDFPNIAEDTVEITYYYNTFRNTFDYLPKSGVTSITRVGNTPDRANYFEPTDYTLIDDKIHWGSVVNVEDGEVSAGSESFSTKFTALTLVDDKVHLEQATGTVNGTNRVFSISRTPTDGSGQDIESDSPESVRVYVGATLAAAVTAGAVTVASVNSSQRTVTLRTAPTSGQSVYVTYWANRLTDDTYTYEVTGTGTYTITSELLGGLSTAQVTLPAGSTYTAYLKPVLTTVGASDTGVLYARLSGSTETINFYDDAGLTNLIGTAAFGQTFVSPAGTDAPEGVWVTIDDSNEFALAGYQSFSFNNNQVLTINVTKGGSFSTTFSPVKFDRYQVPGVVYVVSNTTGVSTGDTAVVTTYDKGGSEPEVSAPYYVTFDYAKTDYSAKVFSDTRRIVAEYGAVSTDNRVSLAASLALQNGAPAVIVKQVQKAAGSADAAAASYIAALEDLQFPVSGINPAVVVPLTTDSTVQAAVQSHVEIQSSPRYKKERIALLGTAIGTNEDQVKDLARGFKSNRVVLVYPDIAVIRLVDNFGREVEQVVDGSIIAAAVSGFATSAAFDVAEPWTNKTISGFVRLGRRFTGPQMDSIASSGVLVLVPSGANLLIRQGLTTDMSNVFTQQPQITTIADTVQLTARTTLAPFIGTKYLAGSENQIAENLANALKALKRRQIIVDYIRPVVTAGASPDTVDVSVRYKPVFSLDYIEVRFTLTAAL